MFRSAAVKVVLALVFLSANTIVGIAYSHKNITLCENSRSWTVDTYAATVGQLLDQEGIPVDSYDQVEPGLETALKDGLSVRIIHGFTVTIVADGEEKDYNVLPATVGQILEAAGITVGEDDLVNPDLEEQVAEATTIKVNRITQEEITVEEEIPFTTVKQSDATLDKGIKRTIQKGIPGQQVKVFEVTKMDGQEIGRDLLSTEIIKKPKQEVLAMGTLQLASRGGTEFRFSKAIDAIATAYTYTGSTTYTGTQPKVGTVAVDPRVIPLGSRLYIEGYGYGVAEDIGSAIKGNKVDVFLETQAETDRWGRKSVRVYILEG